MQSEKWTLKAHTAKPETDTESASEVVSGAKKVSQPVLSGTKINLSVVQDLQEEVKQQEQTIPLRQQVRAAIRLNIYLSMFMLYFSVTA